MYRNGNFRKVAKVFILVFLCSEMQSSFTQQNADDNISEHYKNIVSGYEAAQENSKYQASIRLSALDRNFGDGHICGGAVIAPSVVLTVAHCVYDYDKKSPRHPAELRVVLGNVNRYQRNVHTLVYGVTHVHQPRSFDPHMLQDNIAVIMLDRDIPDEHPTVQPIAVNGALLHDIKPQPKSEPNFKVTSWGVTQEGIPTAQLVSWNVSKSNDRQCFLNYGSVHNEGLLCMDSKSDVNKLSTPLCLQDAGAPLLNKNELWGLAAISNDCKLQTHPGLYIDVAHHSKWIMDRVGTGYNQNSSIWGTLCFLFLSFFALKASRFIKL